MRNYSYENDFDLHENETACRTHFHMKGFALRLVLKQRHERTPKWPIMLPEGGTVVAFCGRILALGWGNLQMSGGSPGSTPRDGR